MSVAVATRRLHPLAGLLVALRWGRGLVVQAAALLWLIHVRGQSMVAVVTAMVVALVALGALHWWRFTYRVVDDRLEVDWGIVSRRHRVVPLQRVRGVALDEPMLHRVFGLVRARVEAAVANTPGGEVALSAVSRAQADALRDAVLRAGPTATVGPGLLALAGLTSLRHVMVPVAVVGAAWGRASDLGLTHRVERLGGGLAHHLPHTRGTGVGLAVLLLLLIVAAAVVGSLITDWGFRLRVDATRLSTERGLLARRRTATQRSRLVGVEVRDNPLRRLCGLATLDAAVGGLTVRKEGETPGRVRLLPIARPPLVRSLLAELVPGDPPPLRAHPRAALARRVVRAEAVPVVLLALALWGGGPWEVAAAGAAIVVMGAVAVGRYRSLGHGIGRWLVVRRGWLGRRHSVLEPRHVVGVTVRSSPFQRRRGLCTTTVHLGLGVGDRPVTDAAHAQAAELVRGLIPWAGSGA